MIGTTVAHFKVLQHLGQGGMGDVYLAQDTTLERLVALKFIADESRDDPVAGERFLREAKAVAALNHPHICTIFETGVFEGRPFIAMEYLAGKTLRAHMAAGPVAPEEVVSIGLQLADALAEAHAKDILHRDLKPENVFVGERTTVKLLDFGLAKSIAASAAGGDADPPTVLPDARTATMRREVRPALPTLTQSGVLVGTVSYMSPEQVRGDRLDSRSDLFSFGVVLYEAVTGRPAFAGGTMMEVMSSILFFTPPSPQSLRPDVPVSLSGLIERLIQKDPGLRIESAAAVRDALIGATTNGAEGGGPASSLPSLGVKRPTRHVWIITLGIIACVEWALMTYVLRRPEHVFQWLGLAGLACIGIGAIVWRVTPRASQGEASAKLVRLQTKSAPSRRPAVMWWGAIVVATISTLSIALLAWLSLDQKSTSPLGMLAAYTVVGAIMWTIVLRCWGWWNRPHTRWHRALELEVEGTYPQVLARCSNALSAAGAHVTGLDVPRGHIEAQTSMAMLGWGEKLTFRIVRGGSAACSIAIESDCLIPVVFSDFGKNDKNLRVIAEALVR